jgi:hypothetical protein
VVAYALPWSNSLRVQADVLNLANSLRVINFAGVFSGTALAPSRARQFEFRQDSEKRPGLEITTRPSPS